MNAGQKAELEAFFGHFQCEKQQYEARLEGSLPVAAV